MIFKRLAERRLVRSSRLVDGAWYGERYPDIKCLDLNAIDHYVAFGLVEERYPNALFASEWYISENPEIIDSQTNPLFHFVAIGAKQGRRPHPLFDVAWYVSQYPEVLESGINPLLHYVEIGVPKGYDPNPLFDSDWYMEHYPDVAIAGQNPLAHYVTVGAAEGRKPHPMFDVQWYVAEYQLGVEDKSDPLRFHLTRGVKLGYDVNPLFDTSEYLGNLASPCMAEHAARHFYESNQPFSVGAYRSESVLKALQEAYRDNSETSAVRLPKNNPKRYAVYLQCGRGSLHHRWLTGGDKAWDLLVNHYDSTHLGQLACDAEFNQVGSVPGTKCTSVYEIMRRWPEVIFAYDYVLLLDDDVIMTEQDILRLFEIATVEKLDLLQASLTEDSCALHDVFRTRGGDSLRYCSGVEIMMPVVSRRAFIAGRNLFGESISGWGVDTALGKVTTDVLRGKAAVADGIRAEHLKPIDFSTGQYYQMLYSSHIYPWLEARSMSKRYQAPYSFFERSFSEADG